MKYSVFKIFPNHIGSFVNRSYRISLNFINAEILVYNGQVFYPIQVSKELIGYKVGSFVSTKKHCIYKKDKKKKKFIKK